MVYSVSQYKDISMPSLLPVQHTDSQCMHQCNIICARKKSMPIPVAILKNLQILNRSMCRSFIIIEFHTNQVINVECMHDLHFKN